MNRRHFLHAAAALPLLQSARAQPGALPLARRFGDGRDWWFQRRFGMFVHWGIYAIHGLHEQEQWRYRVPRAEYVKLQQWNPMKYDPNLWLDLAAEAGTLLNTGKPVEFAVDMVPCDHVEHKPYLRLRNLPMDELANTVLVVKLEF